MLLFWRRRRGEGEGLKEGEGECGEPKTEWWIEGCISNLWSHSESKWSDLVRELWVYKARPLLPYSWSTDLSYWKHLVWHSLLLLGLSTCFLRGPTSCPTEWLSHLVCDLIYFLPSLPGSWVLALGARAAPLLTRVRSWLLADNAVWFWVSFACYPAWWCRELLPL